MKSGGSSFLVSSLLNMSRVVLKIVGAQGQGINSIGEVIAKGLKRSGYCVFGYREYMSVIKGGHSGFQIDVSDELIQSTDSTVDVLITVNHHGLERNSDDVRDGGIIVHDTLDWEWNAKDAASLKKRRITVIELPVERMLQDLKASAILGNMMLTAFLWALLRQKTDALRRIVREQFEHKGEEVVQKNFACIERALKFHAEHAGKRTLDLPKPNPRWKDHLLLTGSQAMGLGIVHAGCRAYFGYPMTPSSPLLSYIADKQNETEMVVKQAEDEITAAQMMSGAMFAGARAITATSGGGFDLMTETVSLNGIIENPSVFVLAQRPGPATGLPTWTAQGDLLLAVGSAHGEFPRLVMSVSDARDCFDLMPEAFNYAEEFQTPVIVMTDKQTAEALWTQEPFDQGAAEVRRGKLVVDTKELKKLKSTDRYDPDVQDGISKRWLPGADAADYCAQGDEHNAEGSIDESAANAKAQMEKRMRKMEKLRSVLPEPELFGAKDPEVLLVSWGSNKGVVLDVMKELETKKSKLGYLHYTYLWPLRTERFQELAKKAKKVVLIECNKQGQLGMLLKQECGIGIEEKILKYDGRPFFYDELLTLLNL